MLYAGGAGVSAPPPRPNSLPPLSFSSCASRPPLALWGGVECTLNRVGDRFIDQAARSGHNTRLSDLDGFADLGLKTLRVPLLWEAISPDGPSICDWSVADPAMERIRALGITPIAGLVHHGSGPAYTDLLDNGFAAGLARHAGHVAARFPWIESWTPVNEPLTTARFACLYGHWYPHARDERLFWQALLNQIDGVIAAMAAVRLVNPNARLVQTDDLGHSVATPPLQPQADFDNERRWAGWDLLCGRVIPGHVLWDRLMGFGFEARLRVIAKRPCPPDIIGINHYLTSDRFLDHEVERYPEGLHGQCSFGPVADVEAVRVVTPGPAGLAGALRDAWDRYRLPIALTEIHLGCTREEQLRWLADAWDTASTLRGEGCDIVAVTVWSLLGAYDWASLLTREDGLYESGVYDVSSGVPRPTALAAMVRDFATTGRAAHPLSAQPGWWRRPGRHDFPSRPIAAAEPVRLCDALQTDREMVAQPLLILGATGTLGQAFAGACRLRAIPYVLTSRAELSLDDPASIAACLDRVRPWAVVNATGWVRVDEAEADPSGCFAANRDGALALGEACAARAIALTSFSSDLVFDGQSSDAYVEGDVARPLSVYGSSKSKADQGLATLPGMLVIRTASFFSPFDPHNFASHLVGAAREGRRFAAADDVITSPTFVPDLVRIVLDLMIDRETGLWHLANAGALSWADFAYALADACGLDSALIDPRPQAAMGWAAPRPRQAALASTRAALMPSLSDAIGRFASHQ